MTWTTALSDVRNHLSDGPTDKLRYRKKVIGYQDGTNLIFKTFEFRRITDFTTAVAPTGVYLDNVLQTVTSDDFGSGEFTLAVAPTDGQELRATYYLKWFLDSELIEFLQTASQWIGNGPLYESISDDLQPSAKEYVAFLAYQKLVLRFSEHMSDVYQLHDVPSEDRFNPVETYMKISKQKYDLALALRDDVYSRKGKAKAPRSQVFAGNVRDVPPRR